MSGEDIVISIRGLVNRFGNQTVHEGLDLDVRRGEILGVVGGSGTGKSVLMRAIIGLQSPQAGSIEVFGEQMLDRDPSDPELLAIRKRWGILFQNGALFSTLTVSENVQVPLREYYPDLPLRLRQCRTQIPVRAFRRHAQARRAGARARARPCIAVPRRTDGRARPDRRRSL